jgi:hypothetical protein
MRSTRLLHGGKADHSSSTLSFRVAHMSPSSSGAGARLSLLEGDCVGPTWPILKPGSHEPGFFLSEVLPGSHELGFFLSEVLPGSHELGFFLAEILPGSHGPAFSSRVDLTFALVTRIFFE